MGVYRLFSNIYNTGSSNNYITPVQLYKNNTTGYQYINIKYISLASWPLSQVEIKESPSEVTLYMTNSTTSINTNIYANGTSLNADNYIYRKIFDNDGDNFDNLNGYTITVPPGYYIYIGIRDMVYNNIAYKIHIMYSVSY